VWKAKPVTRFSLKPDEPKAQGIEFTYRSVDGEEGYPGNLDVIVTYLLTDNNELQIEYEAQTDKPTVLNLTNHAYWNLAGAGAADMLDHELTLMADQYLPVDAGAIPLGPLADVKGTVMDFTSPHSIGERIDKVKNEDAPSGYDHCYVLRSQDGTLALAARVKHPASGRAMEVLTTEPAVQLYTSLYLNGDEANGGHKQYAAFCLETQHYPDSPNRPEYPTTVLKPGETYRQTTVYRFATE
jgi:aldose 1-epimerase